MLLWLSCQARLQMLPARTATAPAPPVPTAPAPPAATERAARGAGGTRDGGPSAGLAAGPRQPGWEAPCPRLRKLLGSGLGMLTSNLLNQGCGP